MNEREKVNKDIQEIELGNENYTKYIPFHHILSEDKLASLYINNYKNIEVKFEIISQANIYEEASYNRKVRTIQDLLLDAKRDNILLFTDAE